MLRYIVIQIGKNSKLHKNQFHSEPFEMTVILNFCVLSLVGYYPTLQKYTTWISYTLSNLWYFDNIFTIFQVSISQSIHQYGTFSAFSKRKFVMNWWFHQSFIENTKQPFSKIKLFHIDKKSITFSNKYSYLSLKSPLKI